MFTYAKEGELLILLVYVDDVVLNGTSPTLIDKVKEFIH